MTLLHHTKLIFTGNYIQAKYAGRAEIIRGWPMYSPTLLVLTALIF